MRGFTESSTGYHRHLASVRPQQLHYEADDEDIHNLSFYYPAEIRDFMASEQLCRNPLVKDFENFVEHIEANERYKEKEPNLVGLRLHRVSASASTSDSGALTKNFTVVWRRKCILLKRLLCRQFWRHADTNRDFGPAERRFVAFAPRDRKSSRTNTFRKDAEVRQKLEVLRRDNELALSLVSLVLRREELKLVRLQVEVAPRAARVPGLRASAETCIARVKALTETLSAQYRLELPAEKSTAVAHVEPRIEAPKAVEQVARVDNDLASFVCSLASAMHEYQLVLTDIQKSKFVLVNRKIRYSKNSKCNLMVERRASLLHKRELLPVTQPIELTKRVLPGFGECYLTKTPQPFPTLAPTALLQHESHVRGLSLPRLLVLAERSEQTLSTVRLGLLTANAQRKISLCATEDDTPDENRPPQIGRETKSAEAALLHMGFEEKFREFALRRGLSG